jgi:hypothetical protein
MLRGGKEEAVEGLKLKELARGQRNEIPSHLLYYLDHNMSSYVRIPVNGIIGYSF